MEFFAIILFAIITCVTPGPNNAMIMASGLNYGIRRSLPHYAGICIGFPVMVVAVGLGLATLLDRYPSLHLIMKIAGAAYLSYLAYRIATSPAGPNNSARGKPFSFLQAAAFQWVNPKAWVLAVGALAAFTIIGEGYLLQVLIIGLIFLVCGAPCILLWLWGGAALRRLLQKPLYVRSFNISMATLLMLSLAPVFVDLYREFTA